MSLTRRYFTKAVAPPPKVPRPNHKGKVVLVKAQGVKGFIAMSSRDAAHQMGCSKGGLTTQARGHGNRWTSEQASVASKKCWATRWRKVKGVRVGRPAKRRALNDRVALRAQYADQGEDGIHYLGYEPYGVLQMAHRWIDRRSGMASEWLSERTALRRLGHLPTLNSGVIPVKVIKIQRKKKET